MPGESTVERQAAASECGRIRERPEMVVERDGHVELAAEFGDDRYIPPVGDGGAFDADPSFGIDDSRSAHADGHERAGGIVGQPLDRRGYLPQYGLRGHSGRQFPQVGFHDGTGEVEPHGRRI
jgi:hypothetical protein